jgi:hypothetical protein
MIENPRHSWHLRLSVSSHRGTHYGDPTVHRAQNRALLEWMNRYVLGVETATQQEDVL